LGMTAIQAITGILPANLLEDPLTGEFFGLVLLWIVVKYLMLFSPFETPVQQ